MYMYYTHRENVLKAIARDDNGNICLSDFFGHCELLQWHLSSGSSKNYVYLKECGQYYNTSWHPRSTQSENILNIK